MPAPVRLSRRRCLADCGCDGAVRLRSGAGQNTDLKNFVQPASIDMPLAGASIGRSLFCLSKRATLVLHGCLSPSAHGIRASVPGQGESSAFPAAVRTPTQLLCALPACLHERVHRSHATCICVHCRPLPRLAPARIRELLPDLVMEERSLDSEGGAIML
eukprot:SAG31_NODE_3622_length_4059_cov_2.742905_1_plen_159_part_10